MHSEQVTSGLMIFSMDSRTCLSCSMCLENFLRYSVALTDSGRCLAACKIACWISLSASCANAGSERSARWSTTSSVTAFFTMRNWFFWTCSRSVKVESTS